MADRSDNPRWHLHHDSSDLSDVSTSPTLVEGAGNTGRRSRPGYSRLSSTPAATNEGQGGSGQDGQEEDVADTFGRRASGLGIASGARRIAVQKSPRVLLGSRSPSSPGAPGSSDQLVSPSLASPFPGTQTAYRAREDTEAGAHIDPGGGYSPGQRKHNRSYSSLAQSLLSPSIQEENAEDDRAGKGDTASVRSAYLANNFTPAACPTQKPFYQGRAKWLAVVTLLLSIFSTVFSGIYLIIACIQPRWHHFISSDGAITSSTANVLTTLFAKLIELSFVTVFVGFLGQVLSRRAFSRNSKGVTLAELSMRNWIMQPGTILTHPETIQYAALTFLGLIALFVSLGAMLYTTAAEALVSPQLRFTDTEWQPMQGLVKTSFANPDYVGSQCQTPIPTSVDPTDGPTTCLQIEHAAQGYHNYQRYMSYWTDLANAGNGTIELAKRPNGFGLLHENTTITAQWIEIVDVGDASKKAGRIVNNVSLAMPHAGVFQAARDGINGILQPEELDGLGIYSIRASVPTPVLHVVCANADEKDLAPIVYSEWPNAIKPVNTTGWPYLADMDWLNYNNDSAINSSLSDVFGWGQMEAGVKQAAPVFPKLPMQYNTIINRTSSDIWGRSSIYLLGGAPPTTEQAVAPDPYFLCQLKVAQSPYCSTRYNASASGGTMEALCEDPKDKLAYIHSLTNASSGSATVAMDWPNIASEWANSMSLNTGIVDGNASNSRLLTQLALGPEPKLNADLPSPAEAIAVMAGCTLLMAAQDSPFVEFWNYSRNALENGQYQTFNASIRAQQYASGAENSYQRAFYPVLFLVFATNLAVLLYFLVAGGLVTDFSEPPNLFSLAVNSPPSDLMAGSCGGGPVGDMYRVTWWVNNEGEHLFLGGEEPPNYQKGKHQHKSYTSTTGLLSPESAVGFEMQSPVTRAYQKLSNRRSLL